MKVIAANAFVLALAASACQSAPPPAAGASVSMYQYAGSTQCERGGKTLDALKLELSAAGVQAQSAWCGQDGRMYAQACFTPDGRILVVHIREDQAPAAARLGLKPLGELPDSVVVACR